MEYKTLGTIQLVLGVIAILAWLYSVVMILTAGTVHTIMGYISMIVDIKLLFGILAILTGLKSQKHIL